MRGTLRLLSLAGLLAAALSHSAAQAAPRLQPDLSGLDAVPHFSVAGAQAAHALQARKPPAHNGEPPRFAAGVGLALGLDDGRWQRLDDGSWSWRARVGSPGAKLLNFRFSRFHLPASGALYVYDAQGEVVQGPYTSANQTPEGMLWTAVVPGAEAVLELRVADAERAQVRLALDTVFHGFATLDEAASRAGLTNQSAASCEVNVACPAGANWGDEIRSAAVFTVQDSSIGEFICSGDLVNNQRGDGTPFFLTAHHCRVGWNSSSPASSMVVYWNFQASSCSGTSGSLTDNQTGATFDATDAGSDFNLLTLSAAPASAWNVRFAGVDASGAVPTSGVGIHHPEGDIKKISTYTAPASATDASLCLSTVPIVGACTQQQTVHAWAVNWAEGITEEGSSGSALWDQNHRIVGVLSGGNSACGTSGPDVYGRLDVAWTASGTGGSLAHWLDPDSTGTKVINARDASGPTGPSGGSGTTINSGSSGGGGSAAALLLLAPLAALRRRRARR
jgi:hypothetical protein